MRYAAIVLTLAALLLAPGAALAGPLTDNYEELKAAYPQFFQRLMDARWKDAQGVEHRLTEQEVLDWVADMDELLAQRVINDQPESSTNSSNFRRVIYNVLANSLLKPENVNVFTAVATAYQAEISQFLTGGGLPPDFAGVRDAIKVIVFRYQVWPEPPPQDPSLPLNLTLRSWVRDVTFRYTLDGTDPRTSPTALSCGADGRLVLDRRTMLRAVAVQGTQFSVVRDFPFGVTRVRGSAYLEGWSDATAAPPAVGLTVEAAGRRWSVSAPGTAGDRGVIYTFDLPDLLEAGGVTVTVGLSGFVPCTLSAWLANGSSELPRAVLRAGDLDRDGHVTVADLLLMARAYGAAGTPGSVAGDLNLDGRVDLLDLALLARNFGL